MPTNIGPKIGIEGEAEYRKSIQNIIQQQKTLKAEMEATSSAFDKNASAQEKNKAKAESLNKQIEVQKDRVEKLKSMVDQSAAKYGEADTKTLKWREALANATTELNQMETELAALNPDVDTFGDHMEHVAQTLDDFGGKASALGDSWTSNITQPLVSVGKASISAFKEVDAGMDTLVTKTGATGDSLEGMGDIMKNIATTIPTDFETAGAAVGEVSTRFEVTGDALEDLSTKFVKFAQLNNTDVSSSVDSVQAAMAAFNVDVSDTGAMLDTLNSVAQSTGVDVLKLADDMTTNATTLKEMGFSASDAATFLGNLDKNGIDASSTMNGLKRGLANATAEGKTMDQALDELQTTLLNADSNTEAYSAAIDLFGTKAGPQLAAALQEGRLSLDDLGTALTDNLGNVETTFDATLDPIDQFQTTMNSVKILGADVGNTLATIAVPALQTLGDIVRGVAEKFENLDEDQQQTIITIGLVAAAVGPVLSTIGSISTGIGGLITVGQTLFSGIGALSGAVGGIGALLSGPTLLIIGGVIAAIVAVVAIVENWGAISEWFSGVWNSVTTAVSDAASAVAGWVSDKWDAIKTWTSDTWNSVTSAISDAWTNIKTGVSDALSSVGTWVSDKWESIKSTTSTVWNGVKDSVSTAWSRIKTGVSTAASSVATWVSDKWSAIKTNTSTTWQNIKDSVQANGGGIRGIIATATQTYQTLWSGAFNAIDSITGGRLSAAFQTVSRIMGNIKTAISDKINAAREAVHNAIERIKGFFHFNWSLPHLKLPHLSITGGFSITPPGVPHFSISWYRKAYDNPVMFRTPTVLGTSSGMKGFGDGSGAEIVIGQGTMFAMIRGAVQEAILPSAGSSGASFGDINVVVNAAPGQDARELADVVAEQIISQIQRRRAVFG